MVGLFHVAAVDGKDDVALPHAGPVSGTVVVHVVDVSNHFDLLLLFVVDTVALEGEAIGAIPFLYDDGASSPVLLGLSDRHTVRLHPLQDL